MFGNRSERAERRAKRRAELRAQVQVRAIKGGGFSYWWPDVEAPKSINPSDFLFPWEFMDEPPSDGQPSSGPPSAVSGDESAVCPSCGRRYETSSDSQPSSDTEPEGSAAAGAGAGP